LISKTFWPFWDCGKGWLWADEPAIIKTLFPWWDDNKWLWADGPIDEKNTDYFEKIDLVNLQCDFSKQMSMSITTSAGSFNITGCFRGNNDKGYVIWYGQDNWSHESKKYTTNYNLSNVILDYDYQITGYINGFDNLYNQMIVEYTNGDIKYVNLWNYVLNRPEQDWETGSGELFPTLRTPLSASSYNGSVRIDFDDLYAGETKYIEEESTWVLNPNWEKIDSTRIKSLKWCFTPSTYTGSSINTPLSATKEWNVVWTNWRVLGDSVFADNTAFWDKNNYNLADSYDYNYNVTPERYIKHFYDLGFRNTINLSIGNKFYYEKKSITPLEEDPLNTGEYLYEVDVTKPINIATDAWLSNFLYYANFYGYDSVIFSFSHKTENPIDDLVQLSYDNEEALIDQLYNNAVFCNTSAQDYYKNLALKLVEIQISANMSQEIQIEYPEYSIINNKPCFYDSATKNAFNTQFGLDIHNFQSIDDDYSNYSVTINWLQEQNGNYLELINSYIKSYYSCTSVSVILCMPNIVDNGSMMFTVNYPTTQIKTLDFVSIEDYNWIINHSLKHNTIWTISEDNLGYPMSVIRYFSGIAQINNNKILWNRINTAANKAISLGSSAFISYGMQIRRDSWYPTDDIGGFYTDKSVSILPEETTWIVDKYSDIPKFILIDFFVNNSETVDEDYWWKIFNIYSEAIINE
jgi:hypothetical protein